MRAVDWRNMKMSFDDYMERTAGRRSTLDHHHHLGFLIYDDR